MLAGVCGGQVSDLLELELQAMVSDQFWDLGSQNVF